MLGYAPVGFVLFPSKRFACNYEFLQEKLYIIVHLTVAQTFWKPDISDGIASGNSGRSFHHRHLTV